MLVLVAGCVDSSHGFALAITPIEKIKNPNQEWVVRHIKTGKESNIKRRGVRKWAKANGLDADKIERLINGNSITSQGWKLKDTIIPINYRIGTKYKDIVFINPQGKLQTINNIYRFCKENKLDRKCFYSLINEKCLQYKGWRLPCSKKEFQKKKDSKRGKIFTFIEEKSGKTIQIDNLRAYCRNNKINLNNMYSLHKGLIKKYAGFLTTKKI